MDAQRETLALCARNVAAAQAAGPDDRWTRLVPVFAPAGGTLGPVLVGVRSRSVSSDSLGEMVTVLDAQRAYEANAAVFDIGKRLAERTLEVGRG
jgi:flagellar basal body rod protein FlgC